MKSNNQAEMKMSTCRICKKQDEMFAPMFKYAARHYAHGRCGIERFGAEFLEMIPAHMVKQLPYFALKDAGLLKEAGKRTGIQV